MTAVKTLATMEGRVETWSTISFANAKMAGKEKLAIHVSWFCFCFFEDALL